MFVDNLGNAQQDHPKGMGTEVFSCSARGQVYWISSHNTQLSSPLANCVLGFFTRDLEQNTDGSLLSVQMCASSQPGQQPELKRVAHQVIEASVMQ